MPEENFKTGKWYSYIIPYGEFRFKSLKGFKVLCQWSKGFSNPMNLVPGAAGYGFEKLTAG